MEDQLELDCKRRLPAPRVPPELVQNSSPLRADAYGSLAKWTPGQWDTGRIQDRIWLPSKRAKKNMMSAFDRS